MSLLKQYWKEVAILGLCGVILASHYGPLRPEPEVLERVQVEYRDRIQVVYKDKIVYREKVITKPDGTRIEEKETSREETKKEEEEHTKKDEIVRLEKHPKPRFNIGLTYDIVNQQYNGSVGVRIADLPLFLQASLHGPRWGLGLGLSVELQ